MNAVNTKKNLLRSQAGNWVSNFISEVGILEVQSQVIITDFMLQFYLPNLTFPFGNTAENPNSSSMRSNWLYFAMRSVRLALPVFI